MIKQSHITDLADTPPAPDGSDEASVSVNPLPAIDEVGLRFLRDLYQRAFGFEEIVFEIGDAGRTSIRKAARVAGPKSWSKSRTRSKLMPSSDC